MTESAIQALEILRDGSQFKFSVDILCIIVFGVALGWI